MEKELVSVVIPNFNKGPYISDCLNSVFKQSYKNLEVIVVDDCSTDSSKCIVKDLQISHDNLLLIELEKNGGVSNARNAGMLVATGRYITFLDSDDYYINEKKIENEVKTLAQYNDKYAFAYSKTTYVDVNGKLLRDYFREDSFYRQGKITDGLIYGEDTLTIPRDYCIDLSVLREIGGYNGQMNLFEDLELLVRVSVKCCAICTFEYGTAYRLNTGGLSKVSERKLLRTKWRVCWHAVTYSPDQHLHLRILLLLKRCKIEIRLWLKRILWRED